MVVVERTGTVAHFIGGDEVPSASGRTFPTIDPSTGAEIAQVAFGEAEDIDRAVAAGRAAFESGAWSKAAPGHRAAVLRRLADLIRADADRIGRIESRDTGKPIAQATAEVSLAADFLTYFAGHAELPNGKTYPADAGYFVYSVREPYGVVGAISPWNYPFLLACWKTAPALAVGNSVVLKMAEQTPLSTAELGRLTLEAGMPAGVFNVVHGDGPTTGAALVAHPHVKKLTFTGSTATGQAILRSAADHIKSVHLELGGKTPTSCSAMPMSSRRSPARCSPPSTTPARSAPAARASSSSAAMRTRSSRRSWSGRAASAWASRARRARSWVR